MQHLVIFISQFLICASCVFSLPVGTLASFMLGATLSGNVGLVMSQSMILSGMLQYGAQQTAQVSNQMTSVERIMQYTNLEKEGPFESVPTKKPHRDWPHQGRIVFDKLSLRYVAEDTPVLKSLDIVIEAGEKVSGKMANLN